MGVAIIGETLRIVHPFWKDKEVVTRDQNESLVYDFYHVVAFSFKRFIHDCITNSENWEVCVNQNGNTNRISDRWCHITNH